MSRALTLYELILLNLYRARLRVDQEDGMVAKVHGFGAFVGTVNEFQHPDWDALAETMRQVGPRLAAARELAKKNVAAAVLACDQVDAFNAAFGNGGPSVASEDSSGAQPPPPPQQQQNP
jgi:hypothetical protein